MPDLVALKKLSEGTDPVPFLHAILDGLKYDKFVFPTDEGSDGRIGPFTISKARLLDLREKPWNVELHDDLGLLAAHLNFKIVVGQIKGSNNIPLLVKLKLLHLTVRRRKCQLKINKDGQTDESVAQSIHMGLNTKWTSRPENLEDLVGKLKEEDKVSFTGKDVVSYLEEHELLDRAYMAKTAAGLKDAIEKTIQGNALTVKFVFKFDLDKSWTGR